MCSLSTKGFWGDLTDIMNRDRLPTISGTYEQIARLVGCTEAECVTACNELKQTKTADVTLGETGASITSRRIQREENQRLGVRVRVQRHRDRQDVTPKKHKENGLDRDIDIDKRRIPPTPKGALDYSLPLDLMADPKLVEAWGRWNTHLAEKKVRRTQSAISGQINKLRQLGTLAVSTIENSIAGNYQGLWEPKQQFGGNPQSTPQQTSRVPRQAPRLQ
jgi:hypothetical protein